MLEVPETRREIAAVRMAALRRSAERPPAGAVRRAVGAALVRLGLRLGSHDGAVPPFVAQLCRREEAPTGASSLPGGPDALIRMGATRA